MADDYLKNPVIVRAVSLNASSIPSGYSPAYQQYILSQALDFTNVADKANEAGKGAYDAQVTNDEQNLTLDDHESRINGLRVEVDNHESRISSNTSAIASIQADYVSKSTSSTQSVQAAGGSLLVGPVVTPTADKLQVSGSENITGVYKINGTQVVSGRQTGWTAATGTALLSAFNADLVFGISNPVTNAELIALAGGLYYTRQRIKAIEDAMRSHGLIN